MHLRSRYNDFTRVRASAECYAVMQKFVSGRTYGLKSRPAGRETEIYAQKIGESNQKCFNCATFRSRSVKDELSSRAELPLTRSSGAARSGGNSSEKIGNILKRFAPVAGWKQFQRNPKRIEGKLRSTELEELASRSRLS